jgi:hypothetical protein
MLDEIDVAIGFQTETQRKKLERLESVYDTFTSGKSRN